MKTAFALLSVLLTLTAATLARAEELIIPQGTVVFGELDERITSNGNKFRVGYPVDGHVWKDVVVEGHTIIPAGTPLELRISRLSGKGTGGRSGSLEIMAVSVKAVDGTTISLSGGAPGGPTGAVGLTFEYAPIKYLVLGTGAGWAPEGPKAAFMPRFRLPLNRYFAVGLGFLISAAASYFLSRRLGLFAGYNDKHDVPARHDAL